MIKTKIETHEFGVSYPGVKEQISKYFYDDVTFMILVYLYKDCENEQFQSNISILKFPEEKNELLIDTLSLIVGQDYYRSKILDILDEVKYTNFRPRGSSTRYHFFMDIYGFLNHDKKIRNFDIYSGPQDDIGTVVLASSKWKRDEVILSLTSYPHVINDVHKFLVVLKLKNYDRQKSQIHVGKIINILKKLYTVQIRMPIYSADVCLSILFEKIDI